MAAFNELMMFLVPLPAERRRRPGGDFVSGLLSLTELGRDEVSATCVLPLAAGHETTATSSAPARDRAQLPHLHADPRRRRSDTFHGLAELPVRSSPAVSRSPGTRFR